MQHDHRIALTTRRIGNDREARLASLIARRNGASCPAYD